jgi:putative transposase
MPRRSRLEVPGLPQHIVQRGNNRQACFYHEQDYLAYLGLLRKIAADSSVAVHAYVLMTNHVHLLLSGRKHGAVATLMQDLGREVVRRINACYGRTGTLWEGRYHACVIQSGDYFLACQRYIELNPVRAGMVEDPGVYPWTSFRTNALGVGDPLITPHPAYQELGDTAEHRCSRYRELFRSALGSEVIGQLRAHTQQGGAWGDDRFQAEIEKMLGRRAAWRPRGRPRKPIDGTTEEKGI